MDTAPVRRSGGCGVVGAVKSVRIARSVRSGPPTRAPRVGGYPHGVAGEGGPGSAHPCCGDDTDLDCGTLGGRGRGARLAGNSR